jgi:hypothetical protein
MALVPAHVSGQPSIPITGRYPSLTIEIYIPPTPAWAYDVVVNATLAWNAAQLWMNPSSPTYTLLPTDDGSAPATVSYQMPEAYASFAVGWTSYKFSPNSPTSILSTQTFLDPSVFNQAQEENVTARLYAFRLAIHELGRVLGLGSILDGKDVMDPRATPERALQPVMFSTLDLYALHTLAQGSAPPFVTLPAGMENQMVPADAFLRQGATPTPIPEFNSYLALIAATLTLAPFIIKRRKQPRT